MAAVAAAEVASSEHIVGYREVSTSLLAALTSESSTKRNAAVSSGVLFGSTGPSNFPVILSNGGDNAYCGPLI